LPSQWHQRFQDGYIQFGTGRGWGGSRLFDLRRRTISGVPAYIFENSEGVDLLYRRLKALNQTREYTRLHKGGDLRAYWELVVPTVEPRISFCGGEDWLRRQIWEALPVLGLRDLEELANAARPVETSGVLLQACATRTA
jgi:hypothetical protein